MHTIEARTAFINSQIQMMIAEREVMLAENREREEQGLSHAHGSEQWEAFRKSWENTLGHNAVIELLRDF